MMGQYFFSQDKMIEAGLAIGAGVLMTIFAFRKRPASDPKGSQSQPTLRFPRIPPQILDMPSWAAQSYARFWRSCHSTPRFQRPSPGCSIWPVWAC